MKIEFRVASKKESSQTINTSQFSGFVFNKGDKFLITYKNNKTSVAYINRSTLKTLYIPAKQFPKGLASATFGHSVTREILSIVKI
jgi:hypothetical protein